MAEKEALKRLAANDRACDGCGERVNRFTTACHFDSIFNLVYGSVCGCADRMRNAPFCGSCGQKTNPFVKGSVVIPKAGANEVICPSCAEGLGDFSPETSSKKGSGFVPRQVEMEKVPDLTEAELEAVKSGPYKVIESRPGFYQVGIPSATRGLLSVRSTSGSKVTAMRACARFNA